MIGIGAALLSIGAAVTALLRGINPSQAFPLYIAAALSLLHSFMTTQAAPTMFSQRGHQGDEAPLTAVFNRFERWQTIRVILQLLTFATLIWGMVIFQR